MVSVLQKVLGDPNEKALKRFAPFVKEINELEPDFQKLTNEELRALTDEFRSRLNDGETLDDIMPEAFAAVREAARRNLKQRHYDVQLTGGMVLHRGQIAEMKTGEGKTLVATLAVYTNALQGKGVHVVTVNDYLARRDPVWMSPIYHALGLTIGCLQHDGAFMYDPDLTEAPNGMEYLRPVSRPEAYQADITYGTNNEFGFDYLRDNMVVTEENRVQRELHYAIVDEVDNILIDEARTPLIISGPAEEPVQLYQSFAKLVTRLDDATDYTIDERTRAISLTESGISKMEQWTNTANLYDPENYHQVHYMENALTAEISKIRDRDYVVQDGEVIIVDEYTGRLQPGRRWSDGLHQAVEAKEGIKIQRESITYATITLQNYFRLYDKLAGMTGTALTESDEFYKIYGLEVVAVPTNLPMRREDRSDLVFQTEDGKWNVVTEDIARLHEQNIPVLVGTTAVEDSEYLSDRLKNRGVPHQVLNAKNHQHEASIVAQAGRLGSVTVSTNMAGRGTDIVLGGADTDREGWKEEHDQVISLGGLHVLGTEHHDARRIDNQLRGRAGRQGDPGISQFYVSLEDDLMQRFGGDRIKTVMSWTGLDEDTPVENRIITKSIGSAQIKVEGYHFDMRKHLLEYDDVLNNQREIIYKDRHQALSGESLRDKFVNMLRRTFAERAATYLPGKHVDDWNPTELISEISQICPVPPELATEDQVYEWGREQITEILDEYAETIYQAREEELGEEQMRTVEKLLLLRAIDNHWVQHLTSMENLRTGVGLQAYGQRDPLVVYRAEGHKMFSDLQAGIENEVIRTVFHAVLTEQTAPGTRRQAAAPISPMQAVNDKNRGTAPLGKAGKIGRNAACPCGSGKKYKRCHGATA
ncbi:MAG: preprotein translocase subunit SecA [Chloroflexi bacterium]|nr:preprotein translocase subunit SecA [Chloroflexota bacterium]MDA1270073.1 preprotein translocase subunit SecA [Chloroflexota bacterium]